LFLWLIPRRILILLTVTNLRGKPPEAFGAEVQQPILSVASCAD
jgi:hypothetical protein